MEIVRSVLLLGLPGSPNERSSNAVSYKDRAALPIRCEANLPAAALEQRSIFSNFFIR